MSLLIALVFYQGLIHTVAILFRETEKSFVLPPSTLQWKTWERGWTGKTKLLQPLGTKWPPCDEGPYPGFRGPFSKYQGWNKPSKKPSGTQGNYPLTGKSRNLAQLFPPNRNKPHPIMTSSHTISTIDKYSESHQVTITVRGSYQV